MVKINPDNNNINSNQNINKQGNIKKTNETDNETSIFSNNTTGDEILTQIILGIIDESFFDGTFTADEADIYVKGEKEIAEMVKEEKNKQLNNLNIIAYIFDEEKTEKECREKYAEKHPEYKEVMEEGQRVEKEYEKSLNKAKDIWLKDNPEPEMLEKGGFWGYKETDAHKEWKKKEKEFTNKFEEEYKKNNPDYKTLKNAQVKSMSLWEIIFS